MAEIRVLRIADKSRESAMAAIAKLFAAPMFHAETEQGRLEALAKAIRAQWLSPESGTVTA